MPAEIVVAKVLSVEAYALRAGGTSRQYAQWLVALLPFRREISAQKSPVTV